MTRIIAISDTHCQLNKIDLPPGDILLHCGDLTYSGTVKEISQELNILDVKTKGFKSVVLCAGNHDWLFSEQAEFGRQMCEDRGFIYLDNESVEVEGLKIYGSAYCPRFGNWAFMRDRGEPMKRIWEGIPENLDILMCHGMPRGFLDDVQSVYGGKLEQVGCSDLRDAIFEKKPKIMVGGHLHMSGGKSVTYKDTTYYNAAVCNDQYLPTNKITIIDIDNVPIVST